MDLVLHACNSMLETRLLGALGALDVVSRQVPLVDLVSEAGNSTLEKGSIGALEGS